MQDRQRPVRLVPIDLGDHAEAVLGQPGPDADDGNSAVVAVAVDVDVHPRLALHGLRHQPRERLLALPPPGPGPGRHIDPGVAELQTQASTGRWRHRRSGRTA